MRYTGLPAARNGRRKGVQPQGGQLDRWRALLRASICKFWAICSKKLLKMYILYRYCRRFLSESFLLGKPAIRNWATRRDPETNREHAVHFSLVYSGACAGSDQAIAPVRCGQAARVGSGPTSRLDSGTRHSTQVRRKSSPGSRLPLQELTAQLALSLTTHSILLKSAT